MELTEKRLDDLATKVDESFKQARNDTYELRYKIREDIQVLDARLGGRIQEMDAKFDRLVTLIQSTVGAVVLLALVKLCAIAAAPRS